MDFQYLEKGCFFAHFLLIFLLIFCSFFDHFLTKNRPIFGYLGGGRTRESIRVFVFLGGSDRSFYKIQKRTKKLIKNCIFLVQNRSFLGGSGGTESPLVFQGPKSDQK